MKKNRLKAREEKKDKKASEMQNGKDEGDGRAVESKKNGGNEGKKEGDK